MKQKYKRGDIFSICLNDGRVAICQIIWAPTGKFKKIFSFCVRRFQVNNTVNNEDPLHELIVLNDNGKQLKIIFTGVHNIINGDWKIIGHEDLPEKNDELLYFNYAGTLYKEELEMRKIVFEEYKDYNTMEVFGLELIQDILQHN